MLKRELYLSKIRGFYDSNLVKILVGIRRCGKSVILRQIIDELHEKGVRDDHIIYVNFEYIEYEDLQDYKTLNKYIKVTSSRCRKSMGYSLITLFIKLSP